MNTPKRIVSVVPSQTELLFDLGLNQEIVGLTKFCIHPAGRVAGKTVVGGTKTLHLDRIAALEPDLIIANREENTRQQIEQLQRSYPVHVTDVTDLSGALTMIREVGGLVNRIAPAERMTEQIQQRFAALPVLQHPRPAVAYLIWRNPYMVAASATFIDAMLQAAGFRNAFADQHRYPDVSAATLQAAQPDLIFLSSEPYPFRSQHLAKMQAICPQAQVKLVDGELFSWYGSRLLQAAHYVGQLRQASIRPDL